VVPTRLCHVRNFCNISSSPLSISVIDVVLEVIVVVLDGNGRKHREVTCIWASDENE
jgi:hypothetical protein